MIGVTRFLLATACLWVLGSLPALSCPTESANPTDYIRRDNNRCEGIRSRSVVSGSVELVSLTTSSDGTLTSPLQIQVPKLSSSLPNVLIRAIESRYQLDQMSLSSDGSFYSFNLPTAILNQVPISLSDLRATATMGEQVVYLPVILQQPSNAYSFVFYSVNSVRFTKAEIRKDGTPVTSWGAQNARRYEKEFEWMPASASAGRYEFYYTAEIEQLNQSPETLSRSIVFEHNPDWLR